MEIIGYFLALFVGISLGLMGGGGSILTVPLLVYFFHVNPFLASSYSLIIVGISSLVGVFSYWQEKNIDVNSLINFGFPSILAVFLTKSYLVPIIPQKIHLFNSLDLNRNSLLLLFFALILIIASLSMIKNDVIQNELPKTNKLKLIFQGILTGFITGIVGIGGGFLIIPALVKICRLPMKKAIGTSLLIIVLNAIMGIASVSNFKDFNYNLIVKIVFISLAGMALGILISRKIEGKRLKKAFGWFVLIMGITIISIEILKELI